MPTLRDSKFLVQPSVVYIPHAMTDATPSSAAAPGADPTAAQKEAGTDKPTDGTAEKSTTFTITKVQVRPGKPFNMEEPTTPNWTNCLTSLPVIPDQPGKYVPMPYTFRLPGAPKPTHIKNVVAKSPPFHLLVDHTIAVIWMVFSAEQFPKSPLGIVQLQWALAFLKTIYLRTGERPKDVELCIDTIENLLIDRYAAMEQQLDTMNKINESSHYSDGAFGSKTVVTKKFPFSVNYAEIVAQLGEVEIHEEPSITSQEAQQELDDLKKAAGVESIEKLDSVSREKAINVLKMWYAEQTGKIKEEMRKLKSIQDQIKNVNDGNFQYLDAAQMELLFLGED